MPRPQEKLTVFWSNAMFGGKTEEAGVYVGVAEYADKTWALIRPRSSKRDNETDRNLITHGGKSFQSVSLASALEAKDTALGLVSSGVDIIWFDEPFLFGDKENITEMVFATLEKAEVVVSTLSRTSEGDWWPYVGEILSKADEIVNCHRAVCWWCKRTNATRTIYVGSDDKKTKEKVGGANIYRPACVPCWNREVARS